MFHNIKMAQARISEEKQSKTKNPKNLKLAVLSRTQSLTSFRNMGWAMLISIDFIPHFTDVMVFIHCKTYVIRSYTHAVLRKIFLKHLYYEIPMCAGGGLLG